MASIRYFEDLETGRVFHLGTISVSEADIIAFAERYDPQPMHTGPPTEDQSLYDEVIASGWHVVCLANRQIALEFLPDTATTIGLGVRQLRWNEPVRAGDTLVVSREVVSSRPSESRPGYGVVEYNNVVTRPDGEKLAEWTNAALVLRRNDNRRV